MIPLSERINLELRHRNPAEVTDLILDTSKSDKIEGLTDEFVNLRELSLVNVGLKSLTGFPYLPNLEKLDLSDNRISGDLDCLKCCPKLCQLLLTSNRIRNIGELLPLRNLTALDTIDLCNCDVTKTDNYRLKVFQLLPQLNFLDGLDRNDPEETDSDEYDYSDGDEHNDDFHPTKAKVSYMPSTNGKYLPPSINECDESGYLHFLDDVVHDGDNDCGTLFDIYNSHYYDDYANTNDSESCNGDDHSSDYIEDCVPARGSKCSPTQYHQHHNITRKRSYSSNDEYESSSKIFIHDGLEFIPSHD